MLPVNELARLDLGNRGLIAIPDAALRQKNLRQLNLYRNQLRALPDAVS